MITGRQLKFLLLLFAVLISTASLVSADAAEISDQSSYDTWNSSPSGSKNKEIDLTSDGESGGLLYNILLNADNDSVINLSAATYSAGQFLILEKENITINGAGNASLIQLTGPSDGFKINLSSQITVKNVKLDGKNTANYGFRLQRSDNITFENVAAVNMIKTAFDISRNRDSVYTAITAENNGGFGITITQGENVTVTGTTDNNSWGGLNVNDKQQSDGGDISTSAVNVAGVNSEESMPIVVEQYTAGSSTNIAENITPPSGINLTSGSIIVSNENGIESGSNPVRTKFILLNPDNSAGVNGQILNSVLSGSAENNTVSIPSGSYDVGSVTVPANVTLSGTDVTLVGTITGASGTTVTKGDGITTAPPAVKTSGGGSGTGAAVIVNNTSSENGTNTPNGTNNASDNNNTVTPGNPSSNSSEGNPASSSSNGLKEKYQFVLIGVVLAVLLAGTAYYFAVRPKS